MAAVDNGTNETPSQDPRVQDGQDLDDMTDEEVTGRLSWISHSVGFQAHRTARHKVGREAGLDSHQWFYRVPFEAFTLAVREDCMVAYLNEIRFGASSRDVEELLKRLAIAHEQLPPIEEIQQALDDDRWVLVAEGQFPRDTEWTECLVPGAPKTGVS